MESYEGFPHDACDPTTGATDWVEEGCVLAPNRSQPDFESVCRQAWRDFPSAEDFWRKQHRERQHRLKQLEGQAAQAAKLEAKLLSAQATLANQSIELSRAGWARG